MLISLLKLFLGRYLLLGGCLAMLIRTLKQTFKQKNKNYIYMLLCKYGEVHSWLWFHPCSHHSPAPVVPVCPTTTPPLDTLFTTSQMFPIAPNCCHSPSQSSFHLQTTPWAVACEAGGRWCVICCCCWDMASQLGFSILKKENPCLAVSEMAGGKGWYPCRHLVLLPPTCRGSWQWWGSISRCPPLSSIVKSLSKIFVLSHKEMKWEKKKKTHSWHLLGLFCFAPCHPLTGCHLCHCPLFPLWPCPCFHPVNSHSQQGAVVVVVWSFIICHLHLHPPCPCLLFVVHHSTFHCPSLLAAGTCNPPHEQWLTGLGWVLAICCCSSITHPPCEQGLTTVGSPCPILGCPRHGCAILTLFHCYNIIYI
jgi:hypothetical protein